MKDMEDKLVERRCSNGKGGETVDGVKPTIENNDEDIVLNCFEEFFSGLNETGVFVFTIEECMAVIEKME